MSLFPFSFWQNNYVYQLKNQLMAYYKLDNFGNTFLDSTPNAYNLTGVCTPQLAPGVISLRVSGSNTVGFDSAFYCTGNNCVQSYNLDFNMYTNRTFTFWLNIQNQNFPGFRVPFSYNSGGQELLYEFIYVYGGSGSTTDNAAMVVFGQDTTTYEANYNIPGGSIYGNWAFFSVQINNSGGYMTITMDNIFTGTATGILGSQAFLSQGTGQIFAIGQPPYFGPGISGAFYVDELSIWNRLLTTDELNYIYNNGRGKTYPFNF